MTHPLHHVAGKAARAAAAGLFLAAGAALLASPGCKPAEPVHEDAHGEQEDFERGPRGGRWLADGDFALELTIFEEGVAPEFRAFVYRDGEPRDPQGLAVELTLQRLGGRVERIALRPRGEYLVGERPVEEPHSFDVSIAARNGDGEHRFQFASYENRVTLEPEQIAAAGIAVATAGPATIHERVVLNGRIAANEDALAHVMPRFPGVVRSVEKRLGDGVEKGDRLAVIESNESLHTYELRAPFSGTVIARDIAPGEFVSTERQVFEIADLSTIWVDLDVYRRDFARLRAGQRVRIDAGDGSPIAESALSYLSPVGSVNTQTLLARAVLDNPDGTWRPGLFVTAEVEVSGAEVPVAVAGDAVQRLRDWDVVFVAEGNVFEAQPVVLGRRDGTQVEVISGLEAGRRYAAAGSFVVKAEIGKSGASHDH
jgi:cobalt-zinc-cadmium efflux system membrane fusion protein